MSGRPLLKYLAAASMLTAMIAVTPRPATAADPAAPVPPVVLTLKNHTFSPDTVTVPSGQRFRIEVINNDDTAEEFESSDLKIEKIVTPGGKISASAGPLKPGRYRFFGEYHPDQAAGVLIAQ